MFDSVVGSSISISDRRDEAVEEVHRVVRPGARFRVVLDTGGGDVAQHEALDRAVVEIDVRELGGAEVGVPPNRLVLGDRAGAAGPDDGEPVILRGDLDLAVSRSLTGWFAPR